MHGRRAHIAVGEPTERIPGLVLGLMTRLLFAQFGKLR
jgi:hypothetical protein